MDWMTDDFDDVCIGGEHISSVSDRFKAFNRGKCPPVIMIPGIMAS